MKYVIASILLCSFLYSCKSDNQAICEKYGLSFNSEREKLGIIPLDEDWELEVTEEVNFDGTPFCLWSKEKLEGRADKYLTFSSKGNPVNETDSYYMEYLDSFDLENIEPVQIHLEHDFEEDMKFFYCLSDYQIFPNYVELDRDERLVTNEFLQNIDYLHFDCGIPWSDLPEVDKSFFPLERED